MNNDYVEQVIFYCKDNKMTASAHAELKKGPKARLLDTTVIRIQGDFEGSFDDFAIPRPRLGDIERVMRSGKFQSVKFDDGLTFYGEGGRTYRIEGELPDGKVIGDIEELEGNAWDIDFPAFREMMEDRHRLGLKDSIHVSAEDGYLYLGDMMNTASHALGLRIGPDDRTFKEAWGEYGPHRVTAPAKLIRKLRIPWTGQVTFSYYPDRHIGTFTKNGDLTETVVLIFTPYH